MEDIYWTKDGERLSPNNRIQIGTSPSSPRLTITNLQPTDAGDYAVIASSPGGVSSSAKTLRIRPSNSPIIDRSYDETNLLYPIGDTLGLRVGAGEADIPVGLDVSLQCTASGSPTPDISWTNPFGVVSEAPDAGLIRSFDSSKAGTYTCTASNSLGTDTASITLRPGLFL